MLIQFALSIAMLASAPRQVPGATPATATGMVTLPQVPGRQPPAVRGIAIDARMAEDLGLTVGSMVRISARPAVSGGVGELVQIAAIVEGRADPSEVARREYRVRLHLDHLQRLLGLDDRVDRIAVGVRTSGTARDSAAAIDSTLARINDVAFGFRAHRSSDVAVRSSRTFRVVERFHRAIGIITVMASGIFLLCLLLLTVEERRRDIAALRLTGISRRTVVRAIVIEAALVSLIGSAIGVVLGLLSAVLVNSHYQAVYRTPLVFARVTPGIVLFCAALALSLGTAAGALAAWRMVRTPPLTLLGR